MAGHHLDRDRLIESAVAASGHADFGAPTWQEGLDRLLDDLDASARLNELGAAIVTAEISGYLTNRLNITAWRGAHPEVAAGAITGPIVIIGQARTGTTILHELLAHDPRLRAPLTWEVDRPCPPPRAGTYETDPRIAEVQAAIDLTDSLIPGFRSFHPVGARLAQECVRITACDFRSLIFSTQYRLPGYRRWLLDEADLSPAYRWHRRFLQHLQSERPGGRWLLKSPAHLWHLDTLLGEYPDATLVQTHRDPVKIIASVSALAAHLRRMASDDAQVTSVAGAAADLAEDILLGLDRSVTARETGVVPAGQVIDVQYADLVADPITVVRRIHHHLGLDLPAETEDSMRGFLAAHPGDRGGSGPRYRFVDTGLDEGELRARSARYASRFDVPAEPVT